MAKGLKKLLPAAGATPLGLRPPSVAPAAGVTTGELAPGQRWSVARKREVVLRLLHGESVEAISRELRIEIYRLAPGQG
jgi:hypothetical protein